MFSVGQELAEQEFLITRDSLVRYAGASGDFNPIHYRDDIALAVGLPGVLAHGMLTMAIAIQPIVEAIGDGARVVDYQVRFTKPVVVDAQDGARLLVSAKVAEVDNARSLVRFDITASFSGSTVLGKAQAWVSFS